MNIFALLAYAAIFFSSFSNGLYLYKRESAPGFTSKTDSLGQLTDEDLSAKTTSGTNVLDFNDEGGIDISIIGLNEPSLVSAIGQPEELWDGDNEGIDLFGDQIGYLNDQKVTGYAPSPHVPFLVQVKARDSIPSLEFGTVLNSELSKADDPLQQNAELPVPDASGQSVVSEGAPLIGASAPVQASVNGITLPGGVTEGGNIFASGGDLAGSKPGYSVSTIDLGLQGPDGSLGFTASSDLAIGLGAADGDVDSNLALAFVNGVPTSGKSSLTATSDTGDSIAPVQLTDPLFADDVPPSLNAGSEVGFSATDNDGDIFSKSASKTDSGSVAPFGVVTLSSTPFAEDSATGTGTDGNDNGNSGNQDGAYWREPVPEDDSDDPCRLLRGSDIPYLQCTARMMRSPYSPFKVPAVPRPDLDIASDLS